MNYNYIFQKEKYDSDFISYITQLFNKTIKKNFLFNILTISKRNPNDIEFEICCTFDYKNIQKNMVNNAYYYPIDIKNNESRNYKVINSFSQHTNNLLLVLESKLWNVKNNSKNIILIYTEISEILNNCEILQTLEKHKVEKFYTSSIGYIIKSYDLLYFAMYNNGKKYLSSSVKISNVLGIEFEFDRLIAILFNDISEKIKKM
jgi:hypothetical protein